MVCPQFDSLPNYALTDHAVCVASRLVIVAVLAPLCDSLPRPIATHLVQTLIVVQVEHECPSLAVGVAVVSLIVRHCHASSRVLSIHRVPRAADVAPESHSVAHLDARLPHRSPDSS